MKKETVAVPEHQHCITSPLKRISWSAIFVGALVALGLSFLLNLFGLAIGLSAITMSETGAMALAIGGIIGIIISIIVSMVVAGYAAGYLGRLYCPGRNLGILYGFTTWSVALLLAASVAAHMEHYALDYSQKVTGTALITMQPSNRNINQEMTNLSSKEKKSTSTQIMVSAHCLVEGAFILFVLFFIGAVSACVGACWGMTCQRND